MSTEEKSLNFIEQIIEEDLKNGLSTDKLRFRFPSNVSEGRFFQMYG